MKDAHLKKSEKKTDKKKDETKLIQIAHGRALCFNPTFTPEREEMEQLVTEMTLHNFCSGIELDLFDKGIVKVYFNPFVHDNSKMDYVTRQLIKLIKRAKKRNLFNGKKLPDSSELTAILSMPASDNDDPLA